jgi:hypothetical protein
VRPRDIHLHPVDRHDAARRIRGRDDPHRHLGAGAVDDAGIAELPGVRRRVDDGATGVRHDAGDVHCRPHDQPGRQPPVHPGRISDDRGLVVADDRLFPLSGYSLYMESGPILWAGFAQGFGLGCTFVPLNLLALSGLPHHILTQGTALRALRRMLGGSIGIAILETELSQNTQIVHSRLMEHLRPDNPLAKAPYLSAPFSLTDPSGIAALNHEVTRQAAMIAYNDDFALMLIVILASLPLLLLVRSPRRKPMPAAADD